MPTIFVLSALAAIGWMAFLWYLSSRSTVPVPGNGETQFTLRKLGHAAAYAVLGVFALTSTRQVMRREWAYASAILVVLVYAVIDETHQTYTPGRVGSERDVLIDVAGGLGAVAVAWAIRQIARKRRFRHTPIGRVIRAIW
ncbi:MAG: VanZ family protein [Chloroflexi bacterium]|nr:VanZ family protein [Chloroflexota bacterium]